MPGGTQKVGLRAVIEGMQEFEANAGRIDQAYGRMTQATERAAGRMSKIGDIARTAIGFGVGTIAVQGLQKAASAAFELATAGAPMVDMMQGFEKLAASYDINSERMMEAMREASRGTIADMDLMASANKALIGAGQDLGKEFGDALPGLLEIARASAKATGQDVGFLFESLVTGIKRSSPMIIDNTGLQLKLAEAQEAYAMALGISVEEMSAEQKQIALLKATLAAGVPMVEAMGSAQETTAEKMAKMRATIQNVKNELAIGLVPLLDMFLTKIALPLAEALSRKVLPALMDMGRSLGRFFDMLMGVRITGAGLVGGIWATIFPEWLAGRVGTVADTLREAIGIVREFFGAFAALREFGLPAALEHISEALYENFGPRASEVFDRFVSTIAGAFGRLRTVLSEVLGGIRVWLAENVGGIFEGVPEALTTGLGTVRTWLEEHLGGLWDTVSEKWDAIQSRYGFGEMDVPGQLQEKLDSVKAFWDEHHAGLAETVRATWDEKIGPKMDEAREKLTGLLDKVREDFPEMGTVITVAGTVIGTAILMKILGPIGLVFSAVKIGRKAWDENWLGIRDKLTEIVGQMGLDFDALRAKGLELWEDFGGNLIRLRDEAIEKLGQIWDTTFGNMATAWDKFWTGFSPHIEAAQKFFNWWVSNELLPRLNKFSLELANTYETHLKPAIKEVVKEISEFLKRHPGIREFLEEAIKLVGKLAGRGFLLLLEGTLNMVTGAIDALIIALKIANPIIDAMAWSVKWAIRAVDSLWSSVNSLWSIIQQAWNWIRSNPLHISISWPSPPNWWTWLMPGSPPPALHGFRAINQELERMSDIFARLGTGMMAPTMTAMMTPALAAGSHVTNVYRQWQPIINASYVETQTPTTIRQDLEGLAILMRMP